jgi:hypothetical protein
MRFPVEIAGYFVGRPSPVLDESELRTDNRGAFKSNMRIPPASEFRVAAEVLVTDVVTAYPRCMSVDNNRLAMIAEIQLESGFPEPLRLWNGRNLTPAVRSSSP